MHCLKMSCSLMKKLFAYEAKCCRRDCVHFGCKHYIQEESSICIVSLRATFLWLEEALLLELWKVRERKPGTTTTVRKKGRSSRTYYRLVHHSTRKTYLRYKIAELNSSAQSAAATQIIKHEQSAPGKFLIYKIKRQWKFYITKLGSNMPFIRVLSSLFCSSDTQTEQRNACVSKYV